MIVVFSFCILRFLFVSAFPLSVVSAFVICFAFFVSVVRRLFFVLFSVVVFTPFCSSFVPFCFGYRFRPFFVFCPVLSSLCSPFA